MMPPMMPPLGYQATSTSNSFSRAESGLAIAERITAITDTSGLDYVGIQDHPSNDGFTDTLSLITWLAARTGHVHLFPNVANLPLRPPAMLAKQSATIDVLSGGRFELGLTTLHTDAQMNAFVFWPSGDRERQSSLFAEEVVPAARESLARLTPRP
jgi:alkanesulfonate monooxygenase SsuD/methylene tetrahydromethanopterin reductase-like flavin-dependent oxidoreductase (luciferase family)